MALPASGVYARRQAVYVIGDLAAVQAVYVLGDYAAVRSLGRKGAIPARTTPEPWRELPTVNFPSRQLSSKVNIVS